MSKVRSFAEDKSLVRVFCGHGVASAVNMKRRNRDSVKYQAQTLNTLIIIVLFICLN